MSPAATGDLIAWFSGVYGAPPGVIWHAPGRVNLIGEHTDYNDGLVLPFAVKGGVLAAARVREDGILHLHSRQMPGEAASIALDALQPGSVTGWAGYAAGAAWALRATGYRVAGADVAIDSDLPIGAGLSSSAALSCAVVSSLATLGAGAGGAMPSPAQIAALARSAEADFVGMPCGIMDQSAAMLCEAGHALLLDCRSGESSLVPLDPARTGLRLLVTDTSVRHALADGRYAQRRAECQRAAKSLGVASLREIAEVSQLAGLAEPVLRSRARHVVTENQRVGRTAELLRADRLADCGALLTASHISLKDDFEVSWPAADLTVSAALSAGALGARMTGGGFGGSVLALVPADRCTPVADAIREALAGHPEAPTFVTVEPSSGASQT